MVVPLEKLIAVIGSQPSDINSGMISVSKCRCTVLLAFGTVFHGACFITDGVCMVIGHMFKYAKVCKAVKALQALWYHCLLTDYTVNCVL